MFDSFSEFLAMGGHGLYVWLAYGVGVMVVLANVLAVRAARKRYFRQARAMARRIDATGTEAMVMNPTHQETEATK